MVRRAALPQLMQPLLLHQWRLRPRALSPAVPAHHSDCAARLATSRRLTPACAAPAAGVGNWRAVSDHVGTKKGAEECRQHYLRVYMEPDSRPLPTPAPEMAQVRAGRGCSSGAGVVLPAGPCCAGPASTACHSAAG